ncbi:MAG: hypothetical protein KGL32_05075 [candidate division NC10 bacterium]|nr:hypothetical protein [candidate division NC10 bacterium]
MRKWEYSVQYLWPADLKAAVRQQAISQAALLKISNPEVPDPKEVVEVMANIESVQNNMNEMGKQGWEAFSVIQQKSGWWVVYRRPLLS